MDSQTKTSKVDVYAVVTNRIIELLEQATVPWQKPWTGAGMPVNLISKRPYRGINLWLLLSLNYERNLFLTWDQVKKLGGSVNAGEHGHVIIYWKNSTKDDGAESSKEKKDDKKPPVLLYYKVFNVAQCRELPSTLIEPLPLSELSPITECETLIATMPDCPAIKYKEQEAYYNIGEDFINMPKKKSFKTVESYYATLFHELVHSTGHEKRLNRPSITEMAEFGSELYSIEELVAELGSAYLSGFCGIIEGQIKSSAAYMEGWLGKLKGDKKFIVKASGMAQRAVDFIINKAEATNSNEEMEIPVEK